MGNKSIAAALLISFCACASALADEHSRMSDGVSREFHYDVERGMKADAIERQQLFIPLGPVKISGPELLPLTWDARRIPERPNLSLDRSGWPFQANGGIFSIPSFDEGSMYFGTCDGIFYCIDKKSGSIRWQKDGLVRVDSSPVLHNGNVYFAAIDDTVYSLDCGSGEVKWKRHIPGVGYQNPKLLNASIYVASSGQLQQLDSSNGEVLRTYAFSGDGADFSWNGRVIAAVVNSDIGFDNDRGVGSVVCFGQEFGKPRWTTALGGACLGTLVCDEDICYLGARDGHFYAIRLTDGEIAWRIDGRSIVTSAGSAWENSPVWADSHVIDIGTHIVFCVSHQLVTAPSALVSADKRTGKVAWSVEHPTKIEGRFLTAEGIIVAMAEDRRMIAVYAADGKSVSFSPLPVIHGEGLFSEYQRGGFGGVSLDQGKLFIIGADAHIWRMPSSSATGALDWPRAQLSK